MAQPEPTDAELNAGTEPEPEPSPKPEPKPEPKASPKPTRKLPKMRSPDSSQKLIVACVGIAVVNTSISDIRASKSNLPKPRTLIGGFAVAIGLLFLSELQPEFAEAIAIVLAVASLVGPNGDALASGIRRLVGGGAVLVDPTKGSTGPTKVM